jgi:two-component system OmpR family sensor kinase
MTRRIAITILLTVWTSIVCAGAAAWFMARAILLADLDASIMQRVMALPALSGKDRSGLVPSGDHFIVQDGVGQTLDRLLPSSIGFSPPAKVVDAALVWLPDGPFRRLTLRLSDGGARRPTTVVYSASAAELERVLQRLAIGLIACGAAAGAIAAAASIRLARIALRPLADAAEAIGAVNETNLDRRVDQNSLPPELQPMARQLNAMLGRLQTSFDQRRRFLADASHELRTPTAAIITTMEVALRRPRTIVDLQEVLQICLSEARHMRYLVQALLRQVRAEGESPSDEVIDFDASELVMQCTNSAQSVAQEKGIVLVASLGAALPVRADPNRLRSVLTNLLSNAIEYNKPGGRVEVGTSVAGSSAQISVKDDGPGISPNDLPNLFQPFYRVNRNRQSDGHLGLGLFLVESHMKSMGGECRVDSVLGRGTIFLVRIPLASCAALITEEKG